LGSCNLDDVNDDCDDNGNTLFCSWESLYLWYQLVDTKWVGEDAEFNNDRNEYLPYIKFSIAQNVVREIDVGIMVIMISTPGGGSYMFGLGIISIINNEMIFENRFIKLSFNVLLSDNKLIVSNSRIITNNTTDFNYIELYNGVYIKQEQ